MQISQVGFPKSVKRSRRQEEQEERKETTYTDKMSHSCTIH